MVNPTILDRIDDTLADRCACGCRQPTGDSAWYASEDCQRRYLSAQTTNPDQVYNRPDDVCPAEVAALAERTVAILTTHAERLRAAAIDLSGTAVIVRAVDENGPRWVATDADPRAWLANRVNGR